MEKAKHSSYVNCFCTRTEASKVSNFYAVSIFESKTKNSTDVSFNVKVI